MRAQYQFDSWTTDNGLPQNSIQSIVQTQNGYLWLSTTDGLVRFDGVRFVVFNKANTKGIRSNRFTQLVEMRDGSLWAGTEDGGITRYQSGTFVTFTTQQGLPSDRIDRMDESSGTLLVITERGIARWDGQKFVPFVSSEPLVSEYFKGHFPNGDDFRFWSDGAALHVFESGAYRTYTKSDGLPSANVRRFYRDQDRTLWVVTRDAGIAHLKDGKFVALPGAPVTITDIESLHQDHEGAVWLGTRTGILARLQNDQWTTFGPETGVRGSLLRIFEDREGNLWIGSFNDGLFRTRRQQVHVFTTTDGLAHDNVYPLLEDHDGSIWAGTWGGGLSHFKDGKFVTYNRAEGWPELITALYQDDDGTLWIGSKFLMRFSGGHLEKFGPEQGYRGDWVFAIHRDRQGTLWIGSQQGLYQFRDNSFKAYTTDDHLPNDRVQSILEDRSGNLWLGTLGGLAIFKNGLLIRSYTESDGLASNHVRTIYEDRDGIIWIGSYDGGITRYKDGRLTTYTTKDGLYNNGAFQILEDDFGNFWISCNLGIYRVKRSELNDFAEGRLRTITSVAYGRRDGMLILECNGSKQPGGIKTRDGRLWFPTQKGIAVIDPARAIGSSQSPPPVLIEDIFVDRQPVTAPEVLHLYPGQQNLEIHYTGLSFVAPEQIRFRYKLVGLDPDWVEVGSRREAFYQHLSPGHYVFELSAANSSGDWTTQNAVLRVIVHPPFWRTWWFISLTAAGIVALTFLAYQRRITQLKRAHAAQEAFSQQLIESQEKERKRIAAELHDSLGQNLLVIKNRALLSLNSPDKVDNTLEQLNEISLAASQAIEEVREIAHDLRPFQLDRLGLTKAIESMIRKVSASSGVKFKTEIQQIDGIFAKAAEINLYRIVQECVNNIIKHSGATEATLLMHRDERGVQITVSDNGKGFILPDGTANRSGKAGFGLSGISERARILGGKEIIQSAPGQGTKITLKIGIQNGHG